jgi:dienelactone hydrolase
MADQAKAPAGPDDGQPTGSGQESAPVSWRRLLAEFLRRRVKEPAVTLGAEAWPGAVAGAVAAFTLAFLFYGGLGRTGLGLVPDMLGLTAAGLLLLFLTAKLLGLLLALLRALPTRLIAVAGSAAAILALTGFPLTVPFLLTGIVAGGAIGAAWRRGLRRFSSVLLLLVPVAMYGFLGVTLLRSGEDPYPDLGRPEEAAGVPVVAAANPSLAGPFEVKTLTYGSGADAHRPEYGTGVAFKSRPVDATPLLDANTGFAAWMREAYWGFDLKQLPLNGRVWYPVGPGPFPMVLIVHGNHHAKVYSDPGYAYLGELLASRGAITVSVDENFLNGDWFGDYEQKENPVRAWLLLQHLRAWRTWVRTPGHPFHGRADLDRVILVGHSRGGQAVALAAAFNRLHRHPEHTDVRFDFGFGIRGVVQIAPNDAARPSGQPLEIRDVNYLLLQGAHDSDVNMFLGDRQFRRVKFTDGAYRFKSVLYIYRANHGQFNTVWGGYDYSAPQAWLLNVAPLLPGEAQRQIAKTCIAAFLETAGRGDRAYLPMFRDWRAARGWLPEDRYITRFEASTFRPVATFEEDLDVGTATLAGATSHGENLAAWSENALLLRDETPQGTKGVYLGWDQEALAKKAAEGKPPGVATYSIRLPEPLPAGWTLSAGSRLVFSLANNNLDEPHADLSVELVAAGDTTVRLPLSRFAPVCPPLKTRLTKWPMENYFPLTRPAELVLQTFSLPLAEFARANAAFDPARLRAIRFVFDRTPKGEVALDDVGLEME